MKPANKLGCSPCWWGVCEQIFSDPKTRLSHWAAHVAQAQPEPVSAKRPLPGFAEEGESYMPPNLSSSDEPAPKKQASLEHIEATISSNETTEESMPPFSQSQSKSQSQSQSDPATSALRSRTVAALERIASNSDELPAPPLSAPPASIPRSPDGSQVVLSQMSIQASQDAPSPPPASQTSFLEPPRSGLGHQAGLQPPPSSNGSSTNQEQEKGEDAGNSSFDVEQMLLGSTASGSTSTRSPQKTASGLAREASADREISEMFKDIEHAASQAADEGLSQHAVEGFGFHFSQLPGVGTQIQPSAAGLTQIREDESQQPDQGFMLHFSQQSQAPRMYPDLDDLQD